MQFGSEKRETQHTHTFSRLLSTPLHSTPRLPSLLRLNIKDHYYEAIILFHSSASASCAINHQLLLLQINDSARLGRVRGEMARLLALWLSLDRRKCSAQNTEFFGGILCMLRQKVRCNILTRSMISLVLLLCLAREIANKQTN